LELESPRPKQHTETGWTRFGGEREIVRHLQISISPHVNRSNITNNAEPTVSPSRHLNLNQIGFRIAKYRNMRNLQVVIWNEIAASQSQWRRGVMFAAPSLYPSLALRYTLRWPVASWWGLFYTTLH